MNMLMMSDIFYKNSRWFLGITFCVAEQCSFNTRSKTDQNEPFQHVWTLFVYFIVYIMSIDECDDVASFRRRACAQPNMATSLGSNTYNRQKWRTADYFKNVSVSSFTKRNKHFHM